MRTARHAVLALVAATLAIAGPDLSAQSRGSASTAPSPALRVAPPAVPGVDGPAGMTEVGVPATPWLAAPLVTLTTAELMAEAPVLDSADAAGVNAPLDLVPGTPNVTVLSHGPDLNPDTNAVPPDPSGDVGPTQYLLAVNGRIRTLSKATGAADGVLNQQTDIFFNAVRNAAATSSPRVRFDRHTGRWIVTMLTLALPNRFLLAVSSSGTITAGTTWTFGWWTNTRKQGGAPGGAACTADAPSLGVDEDAIYLGVNQLCGPSSASLAFDSSSVYVLAKSEFGAGGNVSLLVSAFDALVATPGGNGMFAPQPATNFDTGTNQGYVVGIDNVLDNRLVLRQINNPGGSPTISADLIITTNVDPTGEPIDVPHLGGALPLETLDARLSQAVVRNGRLWTAHHFEVNQFGEADVNGNRNGVRWYELGSLAGVPAQVQSGTVRDTAGANPVSYWNASIMPSGQGHVALGMSAAGAVRSVGAAVATRLASDPPETMTAPVVYSPNVAFTYNLQGAPLAAQAWGRTSSTSVDPTDDMTLWTLQQFVDGVDSYGLRLVRLQAPPPATPVSLSPSTLGTGVTGATVTVNAMSANGSGFFDPGAGFAGRIAAAFSGSGVVVTAVTVLSPTSLRLIVNTVGAAPGARTLTVTNPDGQSMQLAAALTISATGSNTAPVAVNDAGSTPFGKPLNAPAPGVLFNDSDPEGQPLTAQLVTTTSHGALTFNANGSFFYAPAAGFSGTDSFTYRASDGSLLSNVATVTITVGANQAPVFGTTPGSITLFTAGVGVSSGPLPFTVSDPDGTALAVAATSSNPAVIAPTGLAISGAGSARAITVSTVGATSLGTTTITLTASDGSLTAMASFTVTVMASSLPGAPQNLVATTSRNVVQLAWAAPNTPEPVQTYVLEAGFSAGTTALTAPLGNVLAFTTSAPSGVYFVRLRGVTPAGAGPASNEVQITLGEAQPPFAPQSLLATVQGTAVTLQWTENPLGPTIASYQVHAGTAPGQTDIGVIPLAASARGLAVNAPPGTYFVRVVAVNAAGASPASNEAVITIGAGVCTTPATPTGLEATATAGVIGVRWDAAAAGAIPLAYVIRAGSTSGAADRGTFSVPATTTAVGGGVPAGPYFIQIAAVNACGASAPSAEVSVVVP